MVSVIIIIIIIYIQFIHLRNMQQLLGEGGLGGGYHFSKHIFVVVSFLFPH